MLMSFGVKAQIKKYKKWEQAIEVSKKDNKDILIILTGKEWCAPCKILEKNILINNQFEEYAEPRFVVFEIDIPKSHLSRLKSPIVKLHEEFSVKYNATAFPSLILVNKEGAEKLKITESSWELEDVFGSLKSVYPRLSDPFPRKLLLPTNVISRLGGSYSRVSQLLSGGCQEQLEEL